MVYTTPHDFTSKLRADILAARKARDQFTTTTLQTILSAIDNAGAVPIPENITNIGIGSTEVSRRELSVRDMQDLVRQEITEAQQVINEFSDKDNPYANELRQRIAILENYL